MRLTLDKRDGALLAAALAIVALYSLTAGFGFPLDDSWIHHTYGRNLAETGRWEFIPGQLSAASTAPVYTLVLATGYLLNAPYEFWSHLTGALALAGAGMLGMRLADRLLPGSREIALLAGLTLVLSWHLVWAAASGMETMLFSTQALALLWLVWRELDEGRSRETTALLLRGAVYGLLAALTVATRPEGGLMVALGGLALLAARPQGSWRGALLWSLGAGIAFCIFVAPYLYFNYQLTGGPVPDTSAAKQADVAPVREAFSFPVRFQRMVYPLTAGGHTLLFPGALLVTAMALRRLRDDRRAAVHLLPILWAVALIALYAARLPAPFQHGRYVIPALPALIVIGVTGTAHILHWGRNVMIWRVLTRALALSAAVVLLYFAVVLGPSVYRDDVSYINEEMVTPAHWIRDNLPEDELLAVHDIGAIGYFAPRPILDIAGLVTPEVVPYVHDAEGMWRLIQERDARYLMALEDQIPGESPEDERLCPLYSSDGRTASHLGAHKMVIYGLSWDGDCALVAARFSES
jgi:hypothetical protein